MGHVVAFMPPRRGPQWPRASWTILMITRIIAAPRYKRRAPMPILPPAVAHAGADAQGTGRTLPVSGAHPYSSELWHDTT